MTAAGPDRRAARRTGIDRIVGDCELLERVAAEGAATARMRLETVLGPELASRLVGALGARRGRPVL